MGEVLIAEPLWRRDSMKKVLLQCLLFLVFTSFGLADAQVHEWIGQWDMNHDGWRGTLIVSDSKVDCATSPWCHLILKYTDAQGKQITGRIEKIDQKFQHMTFYLNLPNNTQKFDAYLFSW